MLVQHDVILKVEESFDRACHQAQTVSFLEEPK